MFLKGANRVTGRGRANAVGEGRNGVYTEKRPGTSDHGSAAVRGVSHSSKYMLLVVALDRQGFQMLPSLEEDVGVARRIVVDRRFTSVTVRGIVE
uniref:Uncharacterized protein n=1 Tax=Peronospora matthiolae TaxID=2874970 RepID=A0AAV1V5X0_9STRA